MRRSKFRGALGFGAAAVTIALVITTTAGFAARPAGTRREVIRIVTTIPGPRHALATAEGAFDARGYFIRSKASLVFPHGRLFVKRHLISTSYTPPDLTTCWFKIRQKGTFRVLHATGRYRGLRLGGRFHTDIAGRLKRLGKDACSSKIVFYRAVTYEIGTVSHA